MPAEKQINVSLSKDVLERFNELKKGFFMSSDTELIRMAINKMYASWKGEDEVQLLREEVAEMKKKIEEMKQ